MAEEKKELPWNRGGYGMKGPKSLARFYGDRWATNVKRLRVRSNRWKKTELFGNAIITGKGDWATVFLGEVKYLEEPEIHRAAELMESGFDSLKYKGQIAVLSMEQVYLDGGKIALCINSEETNEAADSKETKECVDSNETNESADSNETKECGVCLNEQKKVALVPCGHLILCLNCAEHEWSECPLCRTKVESKLQIFY